MPRKLSTLYSFVASCALVGLCQTALAQLPSTPDTTFGIGGKRIDDLSNGGIDRLSDVLQLADGRLLVAGSSQDSTGMHRCVVIRYKQDGSFDSTFGNQGKSVFRVDNYRDAANSVAIDGAGNIIVGCLVYDMPGGLSQGAIARLRPNGALDPTFGFNGLRKILVGSANNLSQIVRLSDGRMVLGGIATVNAVGNRCYVRLKSNGDFDSTFGINGIVLRPYTAATVAGVSGLAVDSADGSIVSVGHQMDSASHESRTAIWRITAAGNDDLSFGTNGKLSGPTGQYNAVLIQPDRKILAAGSIFNYTTYLDMVVSRFLPGGAADAAFGFNGSIDYGQNYKDEEARALLLLRDSSILVGGSVDRPSGSDKDFMLVCYTPSGSLNTAFSNTGKVQTDIGGSTNDFVYVLRQQTDGKLLAAGSSYFAATQEDFTMLRYEGFPPPPVVTGVAPAKRPRVELTFYPNPGSDQWEADVTGSGYYRVVSSTGTVVLERSFSAQGKLSIPAHQLLPGYYIIQGMINGSWFNTSLIRR